MGTHEIITKNLKLLATTGLVSLLIACGGGSGGSTSQSVVASGVITSLGSIWVNGIEYDTPNGGSYTEDDNTSSIASYKVGQVVSIRGSRNSDGVSGSVTEVDYEAEIEGAASGGAINGVAIVITSSTNITLATVTSGALIDGYRYEISGFWMNDNTIEATFIKDDDDGDDVDEVKGYVEAFSAGSSLTVHGVTYSYSGTPVVAVGDLVEIHFSGTFATIVELEDDFFDNQSEGQEVEIEGAVNTDPADLISCPTTTIDTVFMINLTCIDWDFVPSDGWQDGLTGPLDLVSGLRVEAEGHFNADGILIAKEIKGRGNRVRILSTASNVVTVDGTFDLFFGAIQVTTNDFTEFELSSGSAVGDLDELGHEVRGIRTGPKSIMAIRIKSESVSNEHEIRAEVDLDGANLVSNTITAMAITSNVNADTKLKDDADVIIGAGSGTTTEAQILSFLDSIDDDDIVSTTNGLRHIVELVIDTTSGNGSPANPYAAKQIELEHEDD